MMVQDVKSNSKWDFYGIETCTIVPPIALSLDNIRLLHDSHLESQELMRNLIVFHVEMMGDIMYFHQAIRQPYA